MRTLVVAMVIVVDYVLPLVTEIARAHVTILVLVHAKANVPHLAVRDVDKDAQRVAKEIVAEDVEPVVKAVVAPIVKALVFTSVRSLVVSSVKILVCLVVRDVETHVKGVAVEIVVVLVLAIVA